MFEKIIRFSVHNKLVVALITLAIILLGLRAMFEVPLDAVPDITNNQVQVVTSSPTLAAQEVEQFITYPIEMSVANIPRVEEIRSISRFGLSVVTIVFEEGMPILNARQYVSEQLSTIGDAIPSYLGAPEMMPITTGLGEIYQYTLNVAPGYEGQYDIMELRTIQDWIVKRQLMGTKGVVDISSFGGYVKQYEVAIDPVKLNQFGITMPDVFDALEKNNRNSGGSYIERDGRSFYIRTEGVVEGKQDIQNILVERRDGIPIRIRQLGEVKLGHGVRFGAMTMDCKGETVGGITLMLKGGNSSEVIDNVHERIKQVQGSLPEGVVLEPFLDRSVLVGKTIQTVGKNLIEGGLIVILVLILLLGNLRAGLIVASVIPLSMLFAFIMMDLFGVSANLMSLGAIDFGIVVDGAVIIIEAILHAMLLRQVTKQNQAQFDDFIANTSADIYKTAAFGVLIILVVFVPIMSLTGIEGKMFRPMAQTFSFAIFGAFVLTLTYVPMMSAMFLKSTQVREGNMADRIMRFFQRFYQPSLEFALRRPKLVVGASGALLVVALFIFLRMGAVFIPTLEEGDLAMQMTIEPGSSLTKSVETSTKAEQILIEQFPEVKHVVSKIGTAEVPTDPMGIEDADIMIILKDREEWTTTDDREELISLMKEALEPIDWASFEFTQPIQLRFNELITGAKTDIAVKIFGEDMEELRLQAEEAARVIREVQGAADVKVEQTDGLTQYQIAINRAKCAQYGVNVDLVNQVVRTAYAGEKSGVVYEGERRFDLVVRLDAPTRQRFDLTRIYVHRDDMEHVPLSELVDVEEVVGPVQIQREDTKRRITIGINVRERDVESLVEEINQRLDAALDLPPGYYISYGGAFENLQSAKKRLQIAVPAALLLILFLLYIAFGSVRDSLLIFSAVPLSAVGGVLFLWLRGLPFSISDGVGFIALFGVAVLNGIVMIGYFRKLTEQHDDWSLEKIIQNGAIVRLRPVIMTALVAMLGFVPMAFSGSEGAEVQRPLATVVIGGLVTSTLLTLLVLPAIYLLANRRRWLLKRKQQWTTVLVPFFLLGLSSEVFAQDDALRQIEQDALAMHQEVRDQRLKVEAAKARLKAEWGLGNTDVNAQYGQINSSQRGDYYVDVQQQVQNPWATIERRKALQVQLGAQEQQLQLKEREVKRDVRSAYYRWMAELEKGRVLEQFDALFRSFRNKAELRFSLGEIDQLELGSLLGMQAQIQKQQRQQLRNEQEARKALEDMVRHPLQTDRAAELNDIDSLPIGDEALAPLFNALATEQKEAVLAVRKAEKASYWPQLSVGYFNQQIDGNPGLDGLVAGVSIPLFQTDQRSRAKESMIAVEQADNEVSARLFALSTALEVEQAYASLAMEQWREHGNALEHQADRMMNQALQSYEEGELDYLRFVQLMHTAMELKWNQIDLLRDTHLAIEKLNYYIK